jgi:hypothetical protein
MANRAVLRRAIAIVCAVAFFTVGVAHAMQHFDGGVTFATSHVTVSSTDDSSDASKAAPLALEHCFACTMIGMPAAAQSIMSNDLEEESLRPIMGDVRPHPPAAVTRPPIVTI